MRVRQAVGAIVTYGEQFLIIHKTKINTVAGKQAIKGEWDFVKGKIEKQDQGPEAAILRELKEETGSEQFQLKSRLKDSISFTFPTHIQEKIGYDTQETLMFVVEYVGEVTCFEALDSEINQVQLVNRDVLLEKLTHGETKQFFIQQGF